MVILGGNEAGKSTLLSFVNTMFFGFPDARRRERQFHPLSGGRYGGRLILETGTFGDITIERTRTSGTVLRVYDSQGRQMDASCLQEVFGGISRQVYQNIYSFGLQELWNFEMLSGEEVKNAIYGAGFGTAFLAVSQVEKQLRKERDGLFRPHGRKQPLNQVLSRLKTLNSQIKKAKEGLDLYHGLLSSIQETEDRLGRLREKRRQAVGVLDKRRAALDTWKDWMALSEVQARLSAMDGDRRLENISENHFWKLKGLDKALLEKRGLLKDVEKERKEIMMEMEASAPDEALLEKKEELSSLPAEREKFFRLRELENTYLEQIHQMKQEFCAIQEGLGTNWSGELIRKTVFSVADRSQARGFQERFDAVKEEKRRLSQLLSVRERDRREMVAELEDTRRQIRKKAGRLPDVRGDSRNLLSSSSERLHSAAMELRQKTQKKQDALKNLGTGMSEVLSGADFHWLDSIDPSLLVREAEGLGKKLEENRISFREKTGLLESLKTRQQELESQLESRKRRLQELTLPSPFQGIEEGPLREAISLAQSLSGSISREVNIEIELVKADEELTRCSIEAQRLHGRKKDLERYLLFHLSLVTGIGVLALSGFLFHNGSPPAMWASCLGAGLLFLSACPFLKKRATLEIRELEAQAGSFRERIERIREGRKRLSLMREQILRDRDRLALLLGTEGKLEGEEIAGLLKELKDAEGILEKRDRLGLEVQSILEDLALVSGQLESVKKDIDLLRRERIQLEGEWRGLVSRYHLMPGCSPSSVPLIARKISGLKEDARNIRGLEGEINDLNMEIKQILESFSSLGIRASDTCPEDPSSMLELAREVALEVATLIKEFQELDELGKQREHLKDKLSSLEDEIERIQEELSGLEKKRQALKSEWSKWLAAKGLEGGLPPGQILEIAGLLERARKILSQKEFAERELENTREQMERVQGMVSRLFRTLVSTREVPLEFDSQVAILTERLSEELDREMNRRLLSQKSQDLEREKQRLAGEVSRMEAGIMALLEEVGCSSMEEFQGLFRAFQEREKLAGQKRLLSARLGAVVGSNDYESISHFYGEHRHQDLATKVRDLSRELAEIESGIDELVERRAEIGKKLEELTSSTEHMNLLVQRSCLVQEARELHRRWAVRSLALYILRTAKEKFERENQPEVIKAASRYFSAITMGRYTGIMAAAGTNEIWAVTSTGERMAPEKLSTGTAEQLYLSLRFGVMSACDTGGEVLPVLMDDILVNFDPQRTRQAALAIGELARDRQVLFFTCHPHVAETLKKENPAASIVHLDTRS